MNCLITGGAGYIGSHMVKLLQNHDHNIVILDNFSTGNSWSIKDCEVLKVDLLDEDKLLKECKLRQFDLVFHFAAKSNVAESHLNPILYYDNNVLGTKNLLSALKYSDIKKIIFSSSASVYGNPLTDRISENHPTNPINEYGKSKLLSENLIKNYVKDNNIAGASLRYFNAAGADFINKIGEYHIPETHLIPKIINSVIFNNKDGIQIYGQDYNTIDGTCIRDYVYIHDLVVAHYSCASFLEDRNVYETFNLGSGNGNSILQIINECQRVLNVKIPYTFTKRRFGDPEILVADCNKSEHFLNYKVTKNSLEHIINSNFDWMNYVSKNRDLFLS